MYLSGKRILMVVAPTGFKDEEYFVPKVIFESHGASVATSSLNENAESVERKTVSTVLLSRVSPVYDAVVFVGGPGASVYFKNEIAHKVANDFYKNGKIVAAICIAPAILANAGILSGKKATAFPSEQKTLTAKGAVYTGEPVTQQGRIITGKDPSAAKAFAEKITEALK